MNRRLFLGMVAASAMLGVTSSTFAAPAAPLTLFGTPLKGASRDALREVFKQNGLPATREDTNYWFDIYSAQAALDGASELKVGYVSASGKFAMAEYTFPGFVNTQLVGKVIDLVATKYGRPTSMQGQYAVGAVTAKWNVGNGMQIMVARGWPDTTTYLSFTDVAAEKQMAAEIQAAKSAQAREKANSQSRAF